MITVTTQINKTIDKVWEYFTKPEHIVNWYFAADTWHCPEARNDLSIGGSFCYKMSAKDGSFSFDFEGIYSVIEEKSKIGYELADGRKIIILFEEIENNVVITESFDPENENSLELQQNGWQAILDNFKKYVENK